MYNPAEQAHMVGQLTDNPILLQRLIKRYPLHMRKGKLYVVTKNEENIYCIFPEFRFLLAC